MVAAVLAAAAVFPAASLASTSGGTYERTVTELGQAIGEPDEQDAPAPPRYARTPTELGQRIAPPATASMDPGGFDWGDAAIGAGTMLVVALLGSGAVVALHRRRHAIGSARVSAVSG